MASLDASRSPQGAVRDNGQASEYAVFLEVTPHYWHATDSMYSSESILFVGDEIELPDEHGTGLVVEAHHNGSGHGTVFCLPI